MSTYTDRCAAVTAALQDLARDQEAYLGIVSRKRGIPEGAGLLGDPVEDLNAFNRQKEENAPHAWIWLYKERVGREGFLRRFRNAASAAGQMVHISAPAGEDRAARDSVLALIEAIQAVETHDDAIALVATFTEGA